MREWLLDAETAFEIRDEGLLRLFFCELLEAEEVLDLVRRRRTWFELTAAYFREIGEELEAQDDDVLRYGVELMEWNATWFARLEERLSSGLSSRRAEPPGGNPGSRPVTASAISEQSGWCPTVATGPAIPATARRSSADGRAGREQWLDPELGAGLLGDDRRGLARADERAREDDGGWIRRPRPGHARVLAPARRPSAVSSRSSSGSPGAALAWRQR